MDHQQNSLRVATFDYPPFVVMDNNTIVGGIETTIVREICSRLGINALFSPPADGKRWGNLNISGRTLSVNGSSNAFVDFTADGLFGALTSGEADLGHAQIFQRRVQARIFVTSF